MSGSTASRTRSDTHLEILNVRSRMIRPVLALCAAAGCVLAVQTLAPALTPPVPAAPAAEPNTLKKLVDEKSPAIVSIKFIMKGEGGEHEEEATGAMIEAGGLV